jgi:endo-1,3(4)-beta-glucanase
MQVTAYDTLSVTSTYSDASGNAPGSVILVQGSPFVTYTAATDQTIPVEPIFTQKSDGFFTTTVAVMSTAWSWGTAPAWMPAAR